MFQVQEEETQKLDITTVPSSKVLSAAQHVSLGYYQNDSFYKSLYAYLEYVKMLYIIMIRLLYCGHT